MTSTPCKRSPRGPMVAFAALLMLCACSKGPADDERHLVVINDPVKSDRMPHIYASLPQIMANAPAASAADDDAVPSLEDMQQEAVQIASREADPYRISASVIDEQSVAALPGQ